MNKPGWKDALWQYHVSGLGLCLGIFGLLSVPAIIYLLMSYNPSRIEELGLFAATILCVAGALAIIGILGRRAHRRLKDILTPLQREVAVSISREFLRQQLRTARRW